jgi:hypothetical protein
MLQLASIMPVPGVACCIPAGPRKEAILKQVYSQPTRSTASKSVRNPPTLSQLGDRQQAGDDDSRSVGIVRRHDGEVVLGNTRLRVLTSFVPSADLKEEHLSSAA